ncbi:hypothetical protein QTV49_000477 [Vibrio vulnificus]|nr:hypothetical protein [Vibrio vulnificus]
MTDFDKLPPDLQKLLIEVKDSQTDGGHYDSRGYYAEFDEAHCKPYLNTTILKAQELDCLDIHKDSDWAYEVNEDDENDTSSGVCFITIKPEYLDLIPNR